MRIPDLLLSKTVERASFPGHLDCRLHRSRDLSRRATSMMKARPLLCWAPWPLPSDYYDGKSHTVPGLLLLGLSKATNSGQFFFLLECTFQLRYRM